MFRQIHSMHIQHPTRLRMPNVSFFAVRITHQNLRGLIANIGIVSLCRHIVPGFEKSRVCIKIPSSWEGLQACRILEATGIRTLATTLFTIEQAALAGDMGCRYIAPYVNELKVHFDKE